MSGVKEEEVLTVKGLGNKRHLVGVTEEMDCRRRTAEAQVCSNKQWREATATFSAV